MSLPQLPPSSCSSSYIFHRSRGTHARFPNYSQQSQRNLPGGNLMMFQYLTMRTPSPKSKSGMLEQLGYELATLTPMAWVDIFRRLSLRQQQHRPDSNSIIWLQPAVPLNSSQSLLIRVPWLTFDISDSVLPLQPARSALQLDSFLCSFACSPCHEFQTCAQTSSCPLTSLSRPAASLHPRFVFVLAQCLAPVVWSPSIIRSSRLSCVVNLF